MSCRMDVVSGGIIVFSKEILSMPHASVSLLINIKRNAFCC